MSSRNKKQVLTELRGLLEQIASLRSVARLSATHTEWLLRTTSFLEEVFGPGSSYYRCFADLPWRETGTAFLDVHSPDPVAEIHQRAYIQQLGTAEGILRAAYHHLERSDLRSVYRRNDVGEESNLLVRVINLAERGLRKAIRQTPSSEKDVQDTFESLLIGASIAYKREAPSIAYSSKNYIPDFSVDKACLAIEIKFCAAGNTEKALIPEINDDILAYQTKFENLLFVVYDTGQIRDVDRFKEAFERNTSVMVIVVKH